MQLNDFMHARLVLMTISNTQLTITTGDQHLGCYNPTPLKESRPEIQNGRFLREEEQTNHQSQQDKVTLEKIDVDDMILYR